MTGWRWRRALVLILRLGAVAVVVATVALVDDQWEGWLAFAATEFLMLWVVLLLLFAPPLPFELRLLGATKEEARLYWRGEGDGEQS